MGGWEFSIIWEFDVKRGTSLTRCLQKSKAYGWAAEKHGVRLRMVRKQRRDGRRWGLTQAEARERRDDDYQLY